MCAEYPRAVLCRVLDLPRSRLYAREQRRLVDDGDDEEQRVRVHSERIAGQWPTYGYRRVTAQLRRAGAVAVNGQRVRRLLHALGLAGHARPRRGRTTNSDHPYPRYPHLVARLAITHPDAVWVADITDVRLPRDFVSRAVLMDVYTRAIRGWELSRHLDQALTLTARERAVAGGQVPAIHHSDQGGAVRRDGLRHPAGAPRHAHQQG